MSPLIRKAWWESRIRFLLCAAVLAGGAAEFLVRSRTGFPPVEVPALKYSAFVWGNLIGNHQPIVFAMISLVLGLGGLQRERAAGTAAYTLMLPVTRGALISARALVGIAQVVVLATAPLVAVALLAPVLANHSYPIGQAAHFALLYMAWGVVFFAVGLLWSTLLSGTLSALAACVVTPFIYLILIASHVDERGRWVDANFATFMSGMAYLDRVHSGTSLLGPVFPWIPCAMLLAVAAVVFMLAVWRTKRQDF
ncbi:MAG TPA: ABC transporter permease subunit [Vicinamibacterales bacterium]|jgi:hypothetical protein|nr:ABC transporter permease subunit [Vicinamibacterales bacterium]